MMASNHELALDDIVREVIEENPPEEQGIRPEWENHVGWHRKENIFNLRGRVDDKDSASELHRNLPSHADESSEALPEIQEIHIFKTASFLSASIVAMLIICIILYAHKYYCKTNMSCSLKPKKTEADLV